MVKRGISSVQRTLRSLRNQGCICDIAEKFNAYAGPHGIRQDLFGFIDLIALYPDGIVAIQACGSDFAAHKRKVLENEYAVEWLRSGGKIEIWGWRKVKLKRGGKAMRWSARVEEITEKHFAPASPEDPTSEGEAVAGPAGA
jgi:hypothetical protein